MKKKLFLLLTVFAIALGAVAPALAATSWDLNIHNNTESDVKVTLTGPKNYTFTLEPGKWAKTVVEGTYKYSYTVCGTKQSGEVKVENDHTWIYIVTCADEALYAKFVVSSHLGQALTLRMVGPQNYDLAIELGSNRFLGIQTGFYTYTYDACGTTLTGEVRVLKNGTTNLIVYACEQLANHPLLPITSSPSNLRIGSHYAFPVRITLLGPNNYSFELVTGLNRLNVELGTYSYFFTAYGVTKSGTFTVGEAGVTIIISPLK